MAEHIEVLRIELVNVDGEGQAGQGGQGGNEVGNLLKYGGSNKAASTYRESLAKYVKESTNHPTTQSFIKASYSKAFGIAVDDVKNKSKINQQIHQGVHKAGEFVNKNLGKAPSILTAGTSIAGRYISDTQSLSGATHAAERTQKLSNVGLFGSGVLFSVTTGNYWAMALMLVGRAVQFSLENRKEIYKMKLDRTVSALKQERLVKDTTHRLSNTK